MTQGHLYCRVERIHPHKGNVVPGSNVSADNAPHPGLIVGECRIAHGSSSELDSSEHTDEQIGEHTTHNIRQVGSSSFGTNLRNLSGFHNRATSQLRFYSIPCLTDEVEEE